MTGIFKVNDISTIGGTTPQGEGIEIVGHIGDWTVVTVEDSAISGVQEFNIQPIDDNYLKGITGPQAEGAYNAAAYGVNPLFGYHRKGMFCCKARAHSFGILHILALRIEVGVAYPVVESVKRFSISPVHLKPFCVAASVVAIGRCCFYQLVIRFVKPF